MSEATRAGLVNAAISVVGTAWVIFCCVVSFGLSADPPLRTLPDFGTWCWNNAFPILAALVAGGGPFAALRGKMGSDNAKTIATLKGTNP